MITLFILLGGYGILYVFSRLGVLPATSSNEELAAWAMAFFLFFFGLSHFYKFRDLLRIVPSWVPYPQQTVYLTGVLEILFAFGLLIPSLRFAAGIAVVLFFIAVFPANLNKAIHRIHVPGTLSTTVLSWVRLAYQPLFILWTLYCIDAL